MRWRTTGRMPLELLGRRQAVGRQPGRARGGLLAETGDADLEELVEVAGEDRQELHPLEERVARILGLVEDAGVPVEPGQLAVDVAQARLRRARAAAGSGGPRLERTVRRTSDAWLPDGLRGRAGSVGDASTARVDGRLA